MTWIERLFPLAARERVAGRAFDRQEEEDGPYVDADGYCVVGALCREMGLAMPAYGDKTPTPGVALCALPDAPERGTADDADAYDEVLHLMNRNDDGRLQTPEAVREALGLPAEEAS